MKRYALTLFALLGSALLPAAAQKPLYIVNGRETEEIASIPPEDIERVETLPADEETIARYGLRASNGVLLVTDSTFGRYIARRVEWPDDEPAARVVLRYKITPEGRTVVDQELEVTDKRLRRRVLKALGEAPLWQPARKNGVPVESEGVLRIQLPEGKRIPRQAELVFR